MLNEREDAVLNSKGKNLYEIMEQMKQTPNESLGPERQRLRRQALIRDLMDKLNATELEEERNAMIHEYIRETIALEI
ncbi:MAG TPA: hypothetical protein VLK23_12225 [Thermodesulfobacteriota bacterium]|nr:hypothetical protein [Thermodesulfobacteriota bacterium]